MPIYRPRAFVELAIVLEDDARPDAVRATTSAVAAGVVAGLTPTQLAAGLATPPTAVPPTVISVGIIPRSVEITRNTIRQADECDITIDNRDLPIDPRSIKSMRVSVFLWDAPVPGENELPPEVYQTLAFVGFVDEPSVKMGANDDTVSLKCRDYTSFFLDKKPPLLPNGKPKRYNVDRPFREVVLEMFDDIGPAVAELKQKFIQRYPASPTSDPPNGMYTTNLATIRGRQRWLAEKDDLWTVLSRMCDEVRLLPYFKLDQLYIEHLSEVRASPYVFRYGENVMTLTYKRSYTDGLTRPVEVRLYNPYAATKEQRFLTAQYPSSAAPLTEARKRKVAAPEDLGVLGEFTGALTNGAGAVADALGLAAPASAAVSAEATKQSAEPKEVASNTTVVLLEGDYTQEELNTIAYETFVSARRRDFRGSLTTMDMEDAGLLDYDSAAFPYLFSAPTQPFPEYDSDGAGIVSAPTDISPIPRSVVQMGNSDLIVLDIPARTWEQVGIPGRPGLIRDAYNVDGLPGSTVQYLHDVAMRKRAQMIPLYVKKAVHKYDSEDGYKLTIDFTSPVGTDLED